MTTAVLVHPSAVEIALWAESGPSDPQISAPVQSGPAYRCFLCGAPATGLRFWGLSAQARLPGRGYSPLDAVAGNIAYLTPTCGCARAHVGATRVAVLDGAVTPLRFADSDEIHDFNERTAYNLAAVKAALVLLAGPAEGALVERRQGERRQSAEVAARLADLVVENRANVATVKQLQQRIVDQAALTDQARTESAARLQLMNDAYELIDSLQGQLEDAQCAALSAQAG